MLVQAKRRKPLGAHPRHPLPKGTTKGIMPCKGSVPGHVENFEGLRISVLVSHCFERLLKRTPFPIGIGVVRSKMLYREATMPPKLRKLCSRPWRGWPGDNAKMIDENRDLHVTCILDGLDSLYGVSMTFQLLNTALCGLQQKPMESARAYYNHMAQIMVILRECHGNCYRLGQLARMSKDCFYAGLLPENRPMVVHLKDQPHTTPLDLLRALLEQEENDALTRTQYPPSTSARLDTPTEAGGVLPPTATR